MLTNHFLWEHWITTVHANENVMLKENQGTFLPKYFMIESEIDCKIVVLMV